jgi:hypothetical protein
MVRLIRWRCWVCIEQEILLGAGITYLIRRPTVASINMGVIRVGFIEVYATVAVDAIPQSAREQRWVAIEY